MIDKDLEFISQALDHQLSDEQLKEFNEKMRDDAFRKKYLNFIMDERLLAKTFEIQNLQEQETAPKEVVKKNRIVPFIASIAAAIALAFILMSNSYFAKVTSDSTASVIREGKEININQNFKLQTGDKLLSGEKPLSFTYPDKTSIELKPHSTALVSYTDTGGKKINLLSGDLTADVKKQIKGMEMEIITKDSKALVLGTKFSISSETVKSNLQVHKGKVQFFNTTGSKDYVVGGEFAMAKSDAPVISQESFISDKRKEQEAIRYKRWSEYSKKIINDPDTLAYYDFEDITKLQSHTLHNKALATKNLPLDGEVITTMPLSGRWHQKGSLYFSEYGYVNFQRHEAYNIPGPITVFAWAKVKKFDRPWQTIISKGDGTWRLARKKHLNSMEFCCNGLEPNPGFLFGKKEVNDGKWHLMVGTYDGAKMRLYVDGKLDVERDAHGSIKQDNYPVNIGANSRHKGRDFEGWIDEVGILKRAMTAEEIYEMYEIGKP
ncbi:MAG: FecR domain-containing protein [Lentisphaeraceae bacterium]|nr:FecR domain-containing protein [Lentisphaeraceae bacterium]